MIPDFEHEIINRHLEFCFLYQIENMTFPPPPLTSCGSKRYYGPNWAKGPDSSFVPEPPRVARRDWPSVVFEIGCLESLTRLRFEAGFWLQKSNGLVRIVLVVAIQRSSRQLIFEIWENRPSQWNISTSANPNPVNSMVPTMTQVASAAEQQGWQQLSPGSHFTITGAPLRFHFQDVFLRPPILPETDVILTAANLYACATKAFS
jgi:hypothetical protein